MTILPQSNRGLPHDYADDDTTSICSLYSDLQNSYSIPYLQQDQHQYHHLEATPDRHKPSVSSLDHLPTMLMSQSQNSQCLDTTNDGNNDDNNNSSNNRSSMKLENSLTITTDTDNNHSNTPFYSRNNPFLPTTFLETPGQVSLYSKSIAKPNEINNSERGVAGFVSKLYQSLQMSQNNYTFVRWCRHDGKDMFLIDCIPRFTAEVLPRLFKHCKFQSFVRQLNIYGFQRDTDARKSKDTKDKEICRWYHFFFRPGRRDLIHLIQRKATLHTRRKRIQAADHHPEPMVNMTSADDYSDGDGEKPTPQRHSSASNSISNLNFQQCSSSEPSSSSLVQHPSPQDVYCKTIPAPYFALVDSIMHQTASPSSSPPPTSSSSSSLSLSSLYMQEALQPSMEQLMEQSMEAVYSTSMAPTPPHENIYPPSVYQITDHATQLSPSSSPPLEINMENELQQHLLQLQISYSNDRDFYTKQIQLAHAHIKEQQAHIQQLEAISSHRQHHHPQNQQQQQQQSTVNTTMALINNNSHPSDPVSNYTTKKEPVYETWNCGKDIFGKANPQWPVLSSPHDLPNPHCHSQDVGFYSATPTTTGSPPPHLTHDSLLVSSSSSSSSHTKKVQP